MSDITIFILGKVIRFALPITHEWVNNYPNIEMGRAPSLYLGISWVERQLYCRSSSWSNLKFDCVRRRHYKCRRTLLKRNLGNAFFLSIFALEN